MCIWNTPVADRRCEFCTYRGGCEAYPQKKEVRPELYREIMSEIVGMDVLTRCRRQDLVWARNMIAYQLRKDGLSLKNVGIAVGLNHSTVMNCMHQVERMLERPSMYEKETEIWQKFQNSLNSRKNIAL